MQNTKLIIPIIIVLAFALVYLFTEKQSTDKAIESYLNDEEIDYEIKQLADAIEPVLLVFMAALVLVLALGVFLPVWDLGSVATGAASGR